MYKTTARETDGKIGAHGALIQKMVWKDFSFRFHFCSFLIFDFCTNLGPMGSHFAALGDLGPRPMGPRASEFPWASRTPGSQGLGLRGPMGLLGPMGLMEPMGLMGPGTPGDPGPDLVTGNLDLTGSGLR